MGNLVKQLELDTLGPTFSRLSPSTYPYSNFQSMFNVSFFKFSSRSLTNQIIHKLLLTRSNYQKLLPYTTPFDPHSSLYLSHSHDTPVPQEAGAED